MSTTNYSESNLSNQSYRYDLVVATTAKAINKTLQRYLYKEGKQGETTEIWYGEGENDNSPPKKIDPVEGVNIFDLKPGDPIPDKIMASSFLFAIKATIGSPKGVSPGNIPDIIQLSEDRQKVKYNLFFHDFKVVELKFNRRGSTLNIVEQPDGKPYIFETTVDLNFNTADPESKFKDLDPEMQTKLKNMNTSNMFSVQQLYLDLNSARLQSLPALEGLDPSDSLAFNTIQSKFINTYWKSVSDDQSIILGYAVKKHTSIDKSSIQPTDLDFSVSPFYDDSGNKTEKYKLYTLNYLMTTDNRTVKMGTPFDWNWVGDGEDHDVDGAMAIRREEFADFLSAALQKNISKICVKSSGDMDGTIITWNANWQFNPDTNLGLIKYDKNGGAQILTFNYSSRLKIDKKIGEIFTVEEEDNGDGITGWLGDRVDDVQDAGKTVANWVTDPLFADKHFGMSSTSSMLVKLEENLITIDIVGDMNLDAFDPGDAFDSGNIQGYLGGFEKKLVYKIAVDTSGKLTVKLEGSDSPTIKDADLDENIAAGLDGSTDFAKKLRTTYLTTTTWANDFASSVEKYLNDSGNMWVFPGGQTFTFKNAKFSKYQDLITHLRYANPN